MAIFSLVSFNFCQRQKRLSAPISDSRFGVATSGFWARVLCVKNRFDPNILRSRAF